MINRSNAVRLLKIIEHCEYILSKTVSANMDKSDFDKLIESDIDFRYMISTPLFQIGEHISQLSKDIKNSYTDMQWLKIVGLRNRLVHDYDDVNWAFITDAVYKDLNPLRDYCKMILDNERVE